MKKQFIKILTQMLLLVVYVSISFAQQNVEITVFKDVIETDFAGFNIYQDGADKIATILTKTSPGIWTGVIMLTNGKANLTATAFDESGNESTYTPDYIYDPAPDSPTGITVKVVDSVQ